MLEVWKDVEGYEGQYRVSNLGRVKSLKSGTETILKPFNNGCGYLIVVLCKDNEEKKYKVHRLVAKAFIPNPENLSEVNHLDENKSNNCIDNLEWLSHKDNVNYGSRNERSAKARINHPKRSKKVYQYDLNKTTLIKIWPSTMEIKRQLGYNRSSISQCCLEKYKSAYGYYWSYTKL